MDTTAETIYRMPEGLTPIHLARTIQQIIQAEINGHLTLYSSAGQTWTLYFQVGRLVWAAGGSHRFRRWYRILREIGVSPSSVQLRESTVSPQWEHLALTVLFKRQQVNREGVSKAIEMTLTEVLFDAFHSSALVTQIGCSVDQGNVGSSPVTVMGTCDEFIDKAQAALNAWQQTGLSTYSPNLAPFIKAPDLLQKQVTPKIYQTLTTNLNGQLSIRDLSITTHQNIYTLANFLGQYVCDDLISLRPVNDIALVSQNATNQAPRRDDVRADDRTATPASPMPGPGTPPPPPPAPAAKVIDGPLILCVDDSPQIGYILEHLLQSAGCRCIVIQDAVDAVGQILRRKPDLILLDLVMPVISGYEVCSQIRRVSAFKETPIIILTGNDGVIDRVRAKMVGATDFMAKPIDSEKLLTTVQRYLAKDTGIPALRLSNA
jgi:two-component system, chemotaxis family, response regulator PixG